MPTRTPSQAVAYSRNIVSGFKGLCLVFVRTCYGIPAKYPSAAEAWAAPGKRHVTAQVSHIPAGAPVFFRVPSNKFGHVALHLGGGKFRTNYSARGTVITAGLDHPVFNTMHLLGWREDLNGVDLHLVAPPLSTAKPAGHNYAGEAGLSSEQVKRLQEGLNRVFPAYSALRPDGEYGALTAGVVREFQERTGLYPDGVAGPKTLAELKHYGVKL